MKVAIIGSNSLLAKEIFKYDKFSEFEFHLFGISNEDNYFNFSYFKYPEISFEIDFLLNFDLIIYCAGAGIQANLNESTDLVFELNSFMPIKILNFLMLKEYKGKIFTFGSYFEIGENSVDISFKEVDIITSINPVPNDYCISKRLLSRFLSSVNKRLNWYHLFLPNIYNKCENPNRIIPYAINCIKEDVNMRFTDGMQLRQFLYTDDLIRFMDFTLNNNIDRGFYNISSDESFTIKEVIQIISDIVGKPFKEEYFGKIKGRDESMKILKMNNSKMKSLNFYPEIDIKKGIINYLI